MLSTPLFLFQMTALRRALSLSRWPLALALLLALLLQPQPGLCDEDTDAVADGTGDNDVAPVKKHSKSTNYNQQAISINYEGEGLPTHGTLNGTVIELDALLPTIALNKTEAYLECSSGFMNIKLNFKQPFYGIVYADYDRNSACKIGGNGKEEETIKLPLKGCGTVQVLCPPWASH